MQVQTVFRLIAGILCIAAANVLATAQGPTCKARFDCAWYSFSSGCIPRLPPNAINCTGNGPWAEVYDVPTNKCAVSHPCTSCQGTGGGPPSGDTASAPINLATGNVFITQTDVRLPGLGGGLTLLRTWNSMPSYAGTQSAGFGSGWRFNYGELVSVDTNDGLVGYLTADGGLWTFGYGSSGTNSYIYSVMSPANGDATLTYFYGTTPAAWVLTFKNGEMRTFADSSGLLTSIVDRNGNTTQLAYDTAGRLALVTDAASRHLYFIYPNGASSLVSSVSSDFGITVSYAYDAQGRLIQVTEPDSTFMTFDYDTGIPGRITAVRDSNGKVLEAHTYDLQGRAASSSRANGFDAMTLSYPQ